MKARVELVGARIVDRLGLERLPFRALAAEREAPRYRDQRPIGHDRAEIAGKDLLPEIRPAKLVDRIEPARDFGIGFGHAVEVAHGGEVVSDSECAIQRHWEFPRAPRMQSASP